MLTSLAFGSVAGESYGAIRVSVLPSDDTQTLRIRTAGPKTNVIAVRRFGVSVLVLANAQRMTSGPGCVLVTGRRVAQCSPWVNEIHYIGGEGDDIVDLSAMDLPARVETTAGKDAVVGSQGPNTIIGGDGTDTIYGGPTTDRLDGNAGDDLVAGRHGNDTAVGGAGEDLLSGGSGRDVLVVDAQDEILGTGTPVTSVEDPARTAAVPLANATPIVKGNATAVATNLHLTNLASDKRIAICLRTKSSGGVAFRPYDARAWPDRRDVVHTPRPNRRSWTAYARRGRC